jgi:hypothetical protein
MHKIAISCIYTSVYATSSLDSWRTCDINRLIYTELRAQASRDVLGYS